MVVYRALSSVSDMYSWGDKYTALVSEICIYIYIYIYAIHVYDTIQYNIRNIKVSPSNIIFYAQGYCLCVIT